MGNIKKIAQQSHAAFSKKAKRRTKRAARVKKGKVSCLTLFTSNYGLIITERVLTVFACILKCPALTAINNARA